MSTEILVSIGLSVLGLVLTSLLGLMLWSLKAQIREIARVEVDRLDKIIDERIQKVKNELEASANQRWIENDKLRTQALQGITDNHESSVRRIELLEKQTGVTLQIVERLSSIEATLKVLMRGLHIRIKENGEMGNE